MLGDCDALFQMLIAYLKALGAHEAAELIVVADGAKWIWDRVEEFVKALGIDRARVTAVLDWYHAVETLHEIAGIPANWQRGEKDAWVKRAVRLLRRSDIDRLVEHIRSLAVGVEPSRSEATSTTSGGTPRACSTRNSALAASHKGAAPWRARSGE